MLATLQNNLYLPGMFNKKKHLKYREILLSKIRTYVSHLTFNQLSYNYSYTNMNYKNVSRPGFRLKNTILVAP